MTENEREARRAADRLAACFNRLVDPDRPGGTIDRPRAQRFVLQMLVALYSQSIGLLPRATMTQRLADCKSRQDSLDLIDGLFEAMPAQGKTPDGGLLAVPVRVELTSDEVDLLRSAALEDWSQVRPEIFGTLFEHSLGKAQRHAFGAHFTHPADIMKIVGPTIVEPWRTLIEAAETPDRLRALDQRMQNYTVLDPACGSGNFLYIAYRELKRLEAQILERLAALSPRHDAAPRRVGFVSVRQFYGLEINPFAVELAKITMMIARKLAIDELQLTEHALPLDNLDDNFRVGDALIDDKGNPTVWPQTDVIIGNPPFLDARRMTKEFGRSYVELLARAYPEITRRSDHCVYWFRKAHDALPECTVDDPVAGRAGLVGTQNIRNNESRRGGLDYITSTGTILEAVENQPWSGQANVHVSIANWMKTQSPALLPPSRRLWFRVAENDARDDKRCQFTLKECEFINSSLADTVDLASAAILRSSRSPKRCFEGQQPGHKGFRLNKSEYESLKNDHNNREFLFAYVIATDILTDRYLSNPCYIIDFGDTDWSAAARAPKLLEIVRSRVLPKWQDNASAEHADTGRVTGEHQNRLDTWWRLKRRRAGLLSRIEEFDRYIVCARVGKRPIFMFLDANIHPDTSLTCFTFNDDYSYGILQSQSHWQWYVARCSKLTERFRYTPDSVFDTFPWPQAPTAIQINSVAQAARTLRQVRDEMLMRIKGGLRVAYRTWEQPGRNPLKDARGPRCRRPGRLWVLSRG